MFVPTDKQKKKKNRNISTRSSRVQLLLLLFVPSCVFVDNARARLVRTPRYTPRVNVCSYFTRVFGKTVFCDPNITNITHTGGWTAATCERAARATFSTVHGRRLPRVYKQRRGRRRTRVQLPRAAAAAVAAVTATGRHVFASRERTAATKAKADSDMPPTLTPLKRRISSTRVYHIQLDRSSSTILLL